MSKHPLAMWSHEVTWKKNFCFCEASGQKTWQVRNLWWRVTMHKLHDFLIRWLITWGQMTKKSNISSFTRRMATKLGRVVTYGKGNLPMKLCDPTDHMFTWGHMTNQTQNSFSSAGPIATKLGRVTTYGKGSPHMKSHDSLITCSHEVM